MQNQSIGQENQKNKTSTDAKEHHEVKRLSDKLSASSEVREADEDISVEFLSTKRDEAENEIAKEYTHIIVGDLKHNYDIDKENEIEKFSEEINNLAEIVEKQRPELDESEKIEVLDELFYFKMRSYNHQLQDRINALQILIEDEKYILARTGDKENSIRLSRLENELRTLKSQIIG